MRSIAKLRLMLIISILNKEKEETKREYIYKIAAIYSYYMEHDKLDIIKALEEYLKDGCGLINSERSYYFLCKV